MALRRVGHNTHVCRTTENGTVSAGAPLGEAYQPAHRSSRLVVGPTDRSAGQGVLTVHAVGEGGGQQLADVGRSERAVDHQVGAHVASPSGPLTTTTSAITKSEESGPNTTSVAPSPGTDARSDSARHRFDHQTASRPDWQESEPRRVLGTNSRNGDGANKPAFER